MDRARTILIAAGLVAAGLVCLAVDVPLARWLIAGGMPGELRALMHRAEAFGHAYGVAGIAMTVYLLDGRYRTRVPQLLLAGWGAGLAADLGKLTVWRVRPRYFDFDHDVWSSFRGSPWTEATISWQQLTESTYHSLPSAHTATAVALAMVLGRFYPAGRWWFGLLAALAAMNRVDGGAHFASDVCWGAALGWLVGARALAWQGQGALHGLLKGQRAASHSVASRVPG